MWKVIKPTIKIMSIMALMFVSWLHGSSDGYKTAENIHKEALQAYYYPQPTPEPITGQAFFEEINKHRESVGLHKYEINEELCNGISMRYRELEAKPEESHPGFEEWIDKRNYSFNTIGESYVLNTGNAKEAVESLLNSPSHKLSLEDPSVYQVCTYANENNALMLYGK